MKILLICLLALLPAISYADICGNANMETQILKRLAVNASALLSQDFGGNTDLLLKQYEKLSNNLNSVRKLADISENTLKHCAGKGYTKEIYYLSDKNNVLMSNVYSTDSKAFYDKYLVPNDNWTEAAKALEHDIIEKQSKIKLALKTSVSTQLKQEAVKKKELDAQAKELKELQALVKSAQDAKTKNEQLQAQNIQTQQSIAEMKKQTTRPATNVTSTKTTRNTYQEGQSAAYVERNSLFCMSERQFDYQIRLLSQGIKKGANGCYVTNQDVDVVILDFGMLGKSKVRAVSTETTMWVTSESIVRR